MLDRRLTFTNDKHLTNKMSFCLLCRSSVTEALSKRLMWAQHLCSNGAIYDAYEEWKGRWGEGETRSKNLQYDGASYTKRNECAVM